MKYHLTLCGNKYTENIAKLESCKAERHYFHRSNKSSLLGRLANYLQLSYLIIIRGLIYLIGGEFKISLPHSDKNYGKILNLFNPTTLVLLDDGVTFEYWSDFHVRSIKRLLFDKRLVCLSGPHTPNWGGNVDLQFEVNVNSRYSIISNFFDENFSQNYSEMRISKISSLIIDDGNMLDDKLDEIELFLNNKYLAPVVIISHPARINKTRKKMKKLTFPIENLIFFCRGNIASVFGAGSTALFNIAAMDCNFPVLSFSTKYEDLNEAMKATGIMVLDNFFENV